MSARQDGVKPEAGSAAQAAPIEAALVANPISRMILTHDGSTTHLLSQLLGQQLTLRTTLQAQRPAAAVLPSRLRALLKVQTDDHVVLRRSELLAGAQAITSNKVVADMTHPAVRQALADPDKALGLVLREQRVEHHRALISVEIISWEWPSEGHHLSYRRDYLIHVAGRPALYIRETFHPRIAPLTSPQPSEMARDLQGVP